MIRQHAYVRLRGAVIHLLEVWLQSRLAGWKASQVDLRFGWEFLVLNHDLAQELGTEAIHRRLSVLSVHQAGELFQLLQNVTLEIPFITELQKHYDTWVSSPACSGAHLPFPLVQSSPLNTYIPRRVIQ